MTYARCLKTAFLFLVLITFIGCKSKQENAVPTAGPAQGKAAVPAAAPKVAVSPQDKVDAQKTAALVLSQLEAGDFQAIYRESSPGFKQIGTEAQFVEKFNHTRLRVGALKNPREVNVDTRPDKSIVLVYRLENDHFNTDVRLTFARSQAGKMELSGMNQHDEPKK